MFNLILQIFILIFMFLLLTGFIISGFTFLFLYIEKKLHLISNTTTNNTHEDDHVSIATYIKKCLIEAFYIDLKFILFPFKFKQPCLNTDLSDKSKNLVVLVHGYGRSRTDWLWFQNKLAQKINQPICAVNHWPTLGSIQQISTILKTKISELQAKLNCNKVTLIGHSMGALASCYVSEFLDNDHTIERVILIGAPLHGTKLAILGYGANARQMEPDAKFLTSLLSRMAKSNKKYFYIASKLDNMVIPWQSALLNEQVPEDHQLILPDTSHLELIYSTTVINKIATWLSDK